MAKKPVVVQAPVENASRVDILKRHEIAEMAVADLVSHPRNPRVIDEKAKGGLKRSLERFGIVQPIIVNKRTGFVVGGNQKIPLLKEAGVEKTDVIIVDLDDDEEAALMVALNHQALTGSYTDDVYDIINELQMNRPDMFDELLLFKLDENDILPLADDDDEGGPAKDKRGDPKNANELAIAPQPYESYNYIVLLSRNDIDWTAAREFFEKHGMLRTVKDGFTGPRKSYKVGMGRVIEMREFLSKVRPSVPQAEQGPAADSPLPAVE